MKIDRENFIKKRREEVLSRPAILREKPKKKLRYEVKESIGEKTVRYFLEFNKIKFTQEAGFPDLKFNGHNLFLDFYLPELNVIIEYDGEQHYKTGNEYNNTKKKLQSQKARDNAKNAWAHKRGIIMIRIPYFYFEDCHKMLERKLNSIINHKKQ